MTFQENIRRGTARLRRACMLSLLVLGVASCKDDPAGPGEPQTPDLRFGQIIFEDSQGSLLYSHGDHWHGALRVEVGGERRFKVYFVAEYQEDHASPPRERWFSLDGEPEYRVRITFFDPTLATWTGGPHEGRLLGKFPGSTGIKVDVMRGTRILWTVPTVPLAVTDPTG